MKVNVLAIIVQVFLTVQVYAFDISAHYPGTNSLQRKMVLSAITTRPNVSLVVSSLAMRIPLCKLATVAVGDAKKELMAALGLRNDVQAVNCYLDIKENLKAINELDLILVNKILVNYTYNLDANFINNATETFGVQFDKIGFNYPVTAVKFINRWVESVTFRRLRDVLDIKDINKETSMIIMNAAHFKATWTIPFEIRNTRPVKFHHLNNTVSDVIMMSKVDDYEYYENEALAFKMVTMMLVDYGFSITFVIPNLKHGLPRILSELVTNPDLIQNARHKMKHQVGTVQVPRFKMKSCLDLSDNLKQIGLKKIFDPINSGLDAMLKTNNGTKTPIYLSKAKQKVFIEVDEYGTYRGGVPDGRIFENSPFDTGMFPPGMVPDRTGFLMTGDKPFLFMISMHMSDSFGMGQSDHAKFDLFSGIYYGPE